MTATPTPALDALLAAADLVPSMAGSHAPGDLGGMMALDGQLETPLPMKSMKVRAFIAASVACVEVEQRFGNPLDRPMEVVWRFPLPPQGAVRDLKLICGAMEVAAELRPLEDACERFEEARNDGHTAALLVEARDDVHILTVTQLPPGEDVTVRFFVDELLDAVDGTHRWRFPTCIAPRYLPGQPTNWPAGAAQPDTDRVPDASRLQPPLRLAGGVPLDLEVQIEGPIAGVASSLHAVAVGLGGQTVRVAPSVRATLDRDFVLAIQPDAAQEQVAARARSVNGFTLVEVLPQSAPTARPIARDAVFVIDVSSSMHGSKMDAARMALRSALHGLQAGDRFAMIAFNHEVWPFAPTADGAPGLLEYDAESLARADRWVDDLSADGSTEMLEPLRLALDGGAPEGRMRTVLFVTDGQVWNEAELAEHVATGVASNARLFTLGIDTGVNVSLLDRLARLGGGFSEFAGPEDDIEAVVAGLEARFGAPRLAAVEATDASGHPLVSDGLGRGDLFDGRPLTLLLDATPDQCNLRAATPGTWSAQVPVTRWQDDSPLGDAIGALWARRRILALEDRLTWCQDDKESIEAEMESLSLRHGVLSSRTALLAVERRRTVHGDLMVVQQPAQMPHLWEHPDLISQHMDTVAAMSERSALDGQVMYRRVLQDGGPEPFSRHTSTSYVRMMLPMRRERSRTIPKRRISLDDVLEGIASHACAVEPSLDPGSELAQAQRADGAFAGADGAASASASALALALLVHLGHTRRSGLRKRVVVKVARWLRAQPEAAEVDSVVARALALLEAAEASPASGPLDAEALAHWQKIGLAAALEGGEVGELAGEVLA